MQLKIDLHVHTCYSYDSVITPKDLVFYARRSGLNGVAITDHDMLDSSLRIAKETDFLIVPGMEISSSDGHIIGLGIDGTVPKGLSADETVDRIHKAGGLAVACHPVTFFKESLGNHITSKFDAVEVVNSSAFPFRYSVKHAKQIAARAETAEVAGTDAHYGPEIGFAYTLLDCEACPDEVIETIRKGLCQPFGEAIPLSLRLKRSFLARFKK